MKTQIEILEELNKKRISLDNINKENWQERQKKLFELEEFYDLYRTEIEEAIPGFHYENTSSVIIQKTIASLKEKQSPSTICQGNLENDSKIYGPAIKDFEEFANKYDGGKQKYSFKHERTSTGLKLTFPSADAYFSFTQKQAHKGSEFEIYRIDNTGNKVLAAQSTGDGKLYDANKKEIKSLDQFNKIMELANPVSRDDRNESNTQPYNSIPGL